MCCCHFDVVCYQVYLHCPILLIFLLSVDVEVEGFWCTSSFVTFQFKYIYFFPFIIQVEMSFTIPNSPINWLFPSTTINDEIWTKIRYLITLTFVRLQTNRCCLQRMRIDLVKETWSYISISICSYNLV